MSEFRTVRGPAVMDVDARTDAELLDAAGGDSRVFGVLFDRYSRVVFAAAFVIVEDRRAAEEVTSDAFMVLWRKRESIVLADTVLPWLLATTRYLARNQRRSARRDVELNEGILASLVPSAEHLAVARDLNRQLAAVVAALKPLDQTVVNLCLVDGLSYDDAAERLGISHGQVRNRLSRSRGTMRRLLNDLTEQEES
ncbi:MAG: sigma-70 family RNA polymerase sigma factor [Microbacteriaceae bacterium]|nr:sigma-70 family RNA polymerase sigma factor [Microbacteriaceae bacterium]MCL2793826.1 sigma-70 family RNA polymerase sigma factor [Microbacteriaceae bacterium]